MTITDCQISFATRVVGDHLNQKIQDIPDDVYRKWILMHDCVRHRRDFLQASKAWLQPVDKNWSHLPTIKACLSKGQEEVSTVTQRVDLLIVN